MFNTRNANFTRSGLACILFQIAAISDRGPSRSFYPLRDPIFNHSSFEQNQARVGFSKSVQALGSSHLVLQRRDSLIWNRILFGIGRAFLEKVTLVDLRGHGASSPSFVVLSGAVDLRAS